MTEQTYTIEDIEAARKRSDQVQYQDEQGWEAFIAELQAPKFQPVIGQVYAAKHAQNHYDGEDHFYKHSNLVTNNMCRRPLDQTEVGPDFIPKDSMQWAVDALKVALVDLNDYMPVPSGPADRIREALAKHQG